MALDWIPLRATTIVRSPHDVADWPITVNITRVRCDPRGGFALEFDRPIPERWKWPSNPAVPSENYQYTVWAFVQPAGRGPWLGAGFVEMWEGRPMDTGALPALFAVNDGAAGYVNWWGDVRHLWGEMSDYVPRPGDLVGLMVSAGNARLVDAVTSVRERSQVVTIPLAASDVLAVNFPSDTGGRPMQVNHIDIVEDEFRRQPPETGSFPQERYTERLLDFFRFQKRVMARLAKDFPRERWGYLHIGGENVIDGIKVGRLCDPDGQLYKIGTDIPTTNGPIWTDDGIVQNDHGGKAENYFVPFDGAVVIDPPAGGGGGAGVDVVAALQRLEGLIKANDDHLGRLAVDFTKALAALTLTGPISIFGVRGTITLSVAPPPPKKPTP